LKLLYYIAAKRLLQKDVRVPLQEVTREGLHVIENEDAFKDTIWLGFINTAPIRTTLLHLYLTGTNIGDWRKTAKLSSAKICCRQILLPPNIKFS